MKPPEPIPPRLFTRLIYKVFSLLYPNLLVSVVSYSYATLFRLLSHTRTAQVFFYETYPICKCNVWSGFFVAHVFTYVCIMVNTRSLSLCYEYPFENISRILVPTSVLFCVCVCDALAACMSVLRSMSFIITFNFSSFAFT